MTHAPARRRAAFTLIEMLAAMAIFSILMAIIFTIYSQISRAWMQAEQRTETFQDARLVLEDMARELEGAMATNNTVTGTQITFLPIASASTLPSACTGLAATQPNDQLWFIGNSFDSSGQSYADLTEYGYFVAFCAAKNLGMRPGYYYLLRHIVRSTDSGWDIFASNWDSTPDLGNNVAPVLDNVLRLDLRYQTLDPNQTGNPATNGTITVDNWDTTASTCAKCSGGSVVNNSCTTFSSVLPSGAPTTTLPRAVHIRLAIIDRRAAARLAPYILGKPSWRTSGIPCPELNTLIPNCAGEDLNSLATTYSDPFLATLMRNSLHVFYKTVYLRNAQ